MPVVVSVAEVIVVPLVVVPDAVVPLVVDFVVGGTVTVVVSDTGCGRWWLCCRGCSCCFS